MPKRAKNSQAQRRLCQNLDRICKARLQPRQQQPRQQPKRSTTSSAKMQQNFVPKQKAEAIKRLKNVLDCPNTVSFIKDMAPAGQDDDDLEARIRQRLQELRAKLSEGITTTTTMVSRTTTPPPPPTTTREFSDVVSFKATKADEDTVAETHPRSRKNDLYVNIYNASSGQIEDKQCDHIRMQIMMEYVKAEPNEKCPRFGKAQRINGRFHVVCLDRMSQSWLVQLVERMGYTWNDDAPDARVLAKQQQMRQQRQYLWAAFFYVVNPISKEFMLELLERQNGGPTLNVQQWRIVRFDTVIRDASCAPLGAPLHNGHFVIFDVPKASQRALMNRNCTLHFGLSMVQLERFEH